MGFEDILHGHIPFGVSITLLIIVLAFFVFLSVKMFKKSNDKSKSNHKQAKNYGILFTVSAAVVFLITISAILMHYHISIKL